MEHLTMPATIAPALRYTDRRRLLAHLARLGAPDPERRAAAALWVSSLLQRKGLSWETLVPPAREDDVTPAPAPVDWPRRALVLSVHPALTPDERAYAAKVSGWRAPGAAALVRLRELAERAGGEFG
jgi:hypothetical protein